MFAGTRRRSSNVREMQLFHELKQQFPTVPDNVVSACIGIATHSNKQNQKEAIREILEAALNNQEKDVDEEVVLMGRSPPNHSTTTTTLVPNTTTPSLSSQSDTSQEDDEETTTTTSSSVSSPEVEKFFYQRKNNQKIKFEGEMNPKLTATSAKSDINRNVVKTCVAFSKKEETVSVNNISTEEKIKRPNYLNIKPESDLKDFSIKSPIQLSEKCPNVHKLLNEKICDKPPRSPISNKRIQTKSIHGGGGGGGSPDLSKKPSPLLEKKTVTTPTQTTDTLLSLDPPPITTTAQQSVNLSLNVNCCMDLVQKPQLQQNSSPSSRHKSMVTVTPTQPWLSPSIVGGGDTSTSPRSYTSVNLFLRPPSSEPQAPIDITSHNSSLTYSTSSFDSQKGLESRLQITVGPSSSSSVSSVRLRPRSSYLPDTGTQSPVTTPSSVVVDKMPIRAGSLNNLSINNEPPVVLKQQARIERLRLEMKTEKANLIILQKEVADLEKSCAETKRNKTEDEIEKQLRREIKHLQYQCKQLELEGDKNNDFYNNLYTGQRGPLDLSGQQRRPPLNGIHQIGGGQQHQQQQQHQHQQQQRHNMQQQQQHQYHQNHLQAQNRCEWNCSLCTFLNHPALDHCEQCEMPRILHVSASPGDNIHIHVTPRLSTHVVHSWVL